MFALRFHDHEFTHAVVWRLFHLIPPALSPARSPSSVASLAARSSCRHNRAALRRRRPRASYSVAARRRRLRRMQRSLRGSRSPRPRRRRWLLRRWTPCPGATSSRIPTSSRISMRSSSAMASRLGSPAIWTPMTTVTSGLRSIKGRIRRLIDGPREPRLRVLSIPIDRCRHYNGYKYGSSAFNPYENYIVGLQQGVDRAALRDRFEDFLLHFRPRDLGELLQVPLSGTVPMWVYPWDARAPIRPNGGWLETAASVEDIITHSSSRASSARRSPASISGSSGPSTPSDDGLPAGDASRTSRSSSCATAARACSSSRTETTVSSSLVAFGHTSVVASLTINENVDLSNTRAGRTCCPGFIRLPTRALRVSISVGSTTSRAATVPATILIWTRHREAIARSMSRPPPASSEPPRRSRRSPATIGPGRTRWRQLYRLQRTGHPRADLRGAAEGEARRGGVRARLGPLRLAPSIHFRC